jgi:hypothetical protein
MYSHVCEHAIFEHPASSENSTVCMPHLTLTTRHAAAFDELFVCENFSFDAVTAIFNRIVADVDAGH